MGQVDVSEFWWLSFCDETRPTGTQFLGVAIVRGSDLTAAAIEAWREGCNPGGQVCGWPMPYPLCDPRPWINRLLTREDAARVDAEWLGGKGEVRTLAEIEREPTS